MRTRSEIEQADVAQVRQAASLLCVPEFAFFHVAHRRWYGEAAPDRWIEPHFMLYLYRGEVPFWVRHLARAVLREAENGQLAPRDFGATPTLPPPPAAGSGEVLNRLVLAVVYGSCFVLLTLAAI